MIKFKKPFAIKIISILLSILFLCNASLCAYPVSKDFLRVPIGDYERLQETAKAAYIEVKTQEKLSEIEEGLDKILKDRKQPLSDWTRDKIIRLSMLPLINKITSGFLRNLGDKPSLRRNLFFVMPFVKWLCKRFLLTVNIENETQFEPEMNKIAAFIKDKHGKGMSVSLDNVGDAALSEESAEDYKQFYIKVIKYLGKRDDIEEINLSLKFSALCYEFTKVTEDDQRGIKVTKVKHALIDILRAASSIKGKRVFIRIDMEEYALRDITVDIFKEVIEENSDLAIDREGNLKLGLVIQGYLRDSEGVFSGLLDWAKKMNYRVPVRLVKGAYDKYEKEEARKRGDKSPVFDYKVSTDANYELLSEFLIVHREYFRPVFATHNIRSIARVMALAEYYGLEKSELEFQMLLGMGDEIKRAIVGMGYRIREYVPSGALARGLKYSGRRFAELCNKDNALTRTLKGDYRHLKEKPQFAEGDLPIVQRTQGTMEMSEGERPVGIKALKDAAGLPLVNFTLFGGNWKERKDITTEEEARAKAREFKKKFAEAQGLEQAIIVIFPEAKWIKAVVEEFAGTSVVVGVQSKFFGDYANPNDFTPENLQAKIDEVVAMGAKYANIGHSMHRMKGKGLSDEQANKIMKAILKDGRLIPWYTIEVSGERDALGEIRDGINIGLDDIPEDQVVNFPITPEPTALISTKAGTGVVDISIKVDAGDTAHLSRLVLETLEKKYGHSVTVNVGYGASVKGENAEGIFSNEEIKNALIGGASLEPQDFFDTVINGMKGAEKVSNAASVHRQLREDI